MVLEETKSTLYCVYNTENNMYFGGNRYHPWRKKPRMYTAKGYVRMSMESFLIQYHWSALSEEEKNLRCAAAYSQYMHLFRNVPEHSTRAHEYRAKANYWNEILHLPLEQLLPPYLELREVHV